MLKGEIEEADTLIDDLRAQMASYTPVMSTAAEALARKHAQELRRMSVAHDNPVRSPNEVR